LRSSFELSRSSAGKADHRVHTAWRRADRHYETGQIAAREHPFARLQVAQTATPPISFVLPDLIVARPGEAALNRSGRSDETFGTNARTAT
jgi:hypothetical protein